MLELFGAMLSDAPISCVGAAAGKAPAGSLRSGGRQQEDAALPVVRGVAGDLAPIVDRLRIPQHPARSGRQYAVEVDQAAGLPESGVRQPFDALRLLAMIWRQQIADNLTGVVEPVGLQ